MTPRLTAFCGFFASAGMTTTWSAHGALRPGYDSLRQFISELALGWYGGVQAANFVVGGVLFCCFGVGLRQAARELPPLRRAAPAVVVAGAGLVVCGLCPSDPFPRTLIPTLHGVAHDAAAAVVFVCFGRALWCFGNDADNAFVRACAVVVIVNVVVVGVGFPYAWKPTVPIATDFIGLWQRLAAVAFFVGGCVMAAWTLKSSPSTT